MAGIMPEMIVCRETYILRTLSGYEWTYFQNRGPATNQIEIPGEIFKFHQPSGLEWFRWLLLDFVPRLFPWQYSYPTWSLIANRLFFFEQTVFSRSMTKIHFRMDQVWSKTLGLPNKRILEFLKSILGSSGDIRGIFWGFSGLLVVDRGST